MRQLCLNFSLCLGENYTNSDVWDVDDDGGNDIDNGAIRVSTGQYFGWDGESAIGYYLFDDDKTPESDCGFAGVLVTAFPKADDYADPYAESSALVPTSIPNTYSTMALLASASIGAVVATVMTIFIGLFLLPKRAPLPIGNADKNCNDVQLSLDASSTPLQRFELEPGVTKRRDFASL
jgi:hypothetical protein